MKLFLALLALVGLGAPAMAEVTLPSIGIDISEYVAEYGAELGSGLATVLGFGLVLLAIHKVYSQIRRKV